MFKPLPLVGAWLISPDRYKDNRGYFECTVRKRWFLGHGLQTEFIESGMSYNAKAGTVRGLHYRSFPESQTKMVRCIHGVIDDILLDLRPRSSTYMQHVRVRLDAWSNCAVYIPDGIAHGFQTLEDHCRVQYHMTKEHNPLLATGVRWDDPAFGITLTRPVTAIAERDRTYLNYKVLR
jgi:dTDP-4-dehydrorhamnose 3,5-epimerase